MDRPEVDLRGCSLVFELDDNRPGSGDYNAPSTRQFDRPSTRWTTVDTDDPSFVPSSNSPDHFVATEVDRREENIDPSIDGQVPPEDNGPDIVDDLRAATWMVLRGN